MDAGDRRRSPIAFRVDRIVDASGTEVRFERDTDTRPDWTPGVATTAPKVTLDLPLGSMWVVDRYPLVAVQELGDDRVAVTLGVSSPSFLTRLLLQADPSTTVTAIEGASAAEREALERAPAALIGRLAERYAEGSTP